MVLEITNDEFWLTDMPISGDKWADKSSDWLSNGIVAQFVSLSFRRHYKIMYLIERLTTNEPSSAKKLINIL